MHLNAGHLTGTGLWFAATGFLLLLEIQTLSHRRCSALSSASSVMPPARCCELDRRRNSCSDERIRLGEVGQKHTSAIVVVGCVEADFEGEFEVTLRIERAEAHQQFGGNSHDIDVMPRPQVCFPKSRQERVSSSGCRVSPVVAPKPEISTSRVARPTNRQLDLTHRVFFIPSSRGPPDDLGSYTAIRCQLAGESNLIRVYAEQLMPDGEPLDPLVTELIHLADEVIGPEINALIGPVCDIDSDGKLAVVLSSQLGRADGLLANVEGLTRASDFRRQAQRPIGNEADVIFLSSHLPPGKRLRAILAHEWAHAAIFSRRYGANAGDSEQVHTEDDWLNEALAHVIEIQASGTSSNVAHRIQKFLDRTEASPLIVRDYYRPEFWRHHGCRGAAFSFLDWCRDHSNPQFIDTLIEGDDMGVEHLERAAGRSFESLFRGWTTSLGEVVAEQDAARGRVTSTAEAITRHGLSMCPQAHQWNPDQFQSRNKTLRLRETTAAYVRVSLGENAAHWQLIAEVPTECRLQLTVIPIE